MPDETSATGDRNVRNHKDSILAEIFTVYAEAGKLYTITTDTEFREAVLAIKHGCDFAIERLLPLNEELGRCHEEARARFSD